MQAGEGVGQGAGESGGSVGLQEDGAAGGDGGGHLGGKGGEQRDQGGEGGRGGVEGPATLAGAYTKGMGGISCGCVVSSINAAAALGDGVQWPGATS